MTVLEEGFAAVTGVSPVELALLGALLGVIAAQYIRSRRLSTRLAQSSHRFREFTQASSDWIWETDADHRFTHFLGRPREIGESLKHSKIGFTRWEFANADINEPHWVEHKRCMDLHKPIENFEYAIPDKAGGKRWFLINGIPHFDEYGGFTGYRGTASEITHRKQIETALATRVRQQQCVAILSQVALGGVPLDELFKVASQTIARTLEVELVGVVDFAEDNSTLRLRSGYGWQEDFYGTPLHSGAMAQYTLERTEPVWTRDFATETRFALSDRGRAHNIVSGISVVIGDQSKRYGVLQAFATRPRDFDENDASFFQAVAFVIAAAIERNAAEATLRLRKRALEAIGQGILIADATQDDCPVIYANPAFQHITGYDQSDIIGRNCRMLQGPDSDPEVVGQIRAAIEQAETFRGLLLNYRKDGSEFWNELTISPVQRPDGKVTHFVGVQADVTDRIEMEGQLRQAQKMDAIGQLTGGVAHDFNNLLTVILGNAEIVRGGLAEDHPQKASAELILNAAERGTDLAHRLLAFSRRQSLLPEAFDLNAAIGAMAALIRRTIGEQITLDIDLAEDIDPVYADRSQLETALLNLVLNARDAMPNGGTLSIRTTSLAPGSPSRRDDDAPRVHLLVSDTGVGMSQEQRYRVLEPFFTTKEGGKGTGLGLSMVYGFVTQSGGDLAIDTTQGAGTTIALTLPAAKDAAAVDARDTARLDDTAGADEKILVVEDEANVRAYVVSQLNQLGYRPVEAGTADAAMTILENEPDVALLFTDVVLPGERNGLELARAARALKPDLPVLLTTGYSEELARDERGDAASLPLLPKPFRPHELASSVGAALNRGEGPSRQAPRQEQGSHRAAVAAIG